MTGLGPVEIGFVAKNLTLLSTERNSEKNAMNSARGVLIYLAILAFAGQVHATQNEAALRCRSAIVSALKQRIEQLSSSTSTALAVDEGNAVRQLAQKHHAAINGLLRSGQMSSEYHPTVVLIDQALDKLPSIRAVSYRGTALSVSQQQQVSKVGNKISFPEFLSTDRKRAVAESFNTRGTEKVPPHENGYVLVIDGDSGRDVADISRNVFEEEILFRRDTVFEVTKITVEPDTFGNDRNVIYLKEIGRRFNLLSSAPNADASQRFLISLFERNFVENLRAFSRGSPNEQTAFVARLAKQMYGLPAKELPSPAMLQEVRRILENPSYYLQTSLPEIPSPSVTELIQALKKLRDGPAKEILDELITSGDPERSKQLIRRLHFQLGNLNPYSRYLSLEDVLMDVYGYQVSKVLVDGFKRPYQIKQKEIADRLAEAVARLRGQ